MFHGSSNEYQTSNNAHGEGLSFDCHWIVQGKYDSCVWYMLYFYFTPFSAVNNIDITDQLKKKCLSLFSFIWRFFPGLWGFQQHPYTYSARLPHKSLQSVSIFIITWPELSKPFSLLPWILFFTHYITHFHLCFVLVNLSEAELDGIHPETLTTGFWELLNYVK